MINAMHPFILASYLNTHRITHFNSMTKVSKVLLQLNRIELLYPLQSFTAKTFHQINFGAFLRSQKTHLINLEMKIIYPYLIYTFVKLSITNCGSNWSVFFRLLLYSPSPSLFPIERLSVFSFILMTHTSTVVYVNGTRVFCA